MADDPSAKNALNPALGDVSATPAPRIQKLRISDSSRQLKLLNITCKFENNAFEQARRNENQGKGPRDTPRYEHRVRVHMARARFFLLEQD